MRLSTQSRTPCPVPRCMAAMGPMGKGRKWYDVKMELVVAAHRRKDAGGG